MPRQTPIAPDRWRISLIAGTIAPNLAPIVEALEAMHDRLE